MSAHQRPPSGNSGGLVTGGGRSGKERVSRAVKCPILGMARRQRTGESEMTEPGTPSRPVVFIHGLWLHATSWGPWLELFREAGYAPVAPGWPGDSDTVEETRREPGKVAGHGIDDVVEHYAQVIRGLES